MFKEVVNFEAVYGLIWHQTMENKNQIIHSHIDYSIAWSHAPFVVLIEQHKWLILFFRFSHKIFSSCDSLPNPEKFYEV